MFPSVELFRESLLESGHKYTIFQVESRENVGKSSNSIPVILDAFVGRLGFFGLNEDWIEINHRNAQALTQVVLYQCLADNTKIMPAKRACQMAEQFLALFEDARYFTNIVPNENGLAIWGGNSWAYSGISAATMDTGIICIDSKHIGILWIQEED